MENTLSFLMNDKCFSFMRSFNILISNFYLKIRKIDNKYNKNNCNFLNYLKVLCSKAFIL
jgi:hypothetical protein